MVPEMHERGALAAVKAKSLHVRAQVLSGHPADLSEKLSNAQLLAEVRSMAIRLVHSFTTELLYS